MVILLGAAAAAATVAAARPSPPLVVVLVLLSQGFPVGMEAASVLGVEAYSAQASHEAEFYQH